ncbi:hypothetical protein TNCV_4311831 [Trichonephila clavipes]|nr:hypothetical protein TNCV_4311831 [Trichonephila clavipes]
MPTRSCKDMREAQHDNLKKIRHFESPLKTEEYANWTERGFLMNQGVLYRYVPSPSTATTAVSNRTIHPSTRATTTTANYVSSPGRRRIHRGRL